MGLFSYPLKVTVSLLSNWLFPATTFGDLKNHKVFDLQLGRSESSLRYYLRQLEGREQVRLIVMDLSETHRHIAKQYFPNATIVADRFHVVRLISHHFFKAWKIQVEEGRKNQGLLSLMRRHQWYLCDEQYENLMAYLENYHVLKRPNGSTPLTGEQHSSRSIYYSIPSTMGHHSYSIIFKISKTIRASRYHFHFIVEAFCYAVISCKAPHGHNRL